MQGAKNSLYTNQSSNSRAKNPLYTNHRTFHKTFIRRMDLGSHKDVFRICHKTFIRRMDLGSHKDTSNGFGQSQRHVEWIWAVTKTLSE